jgi:hypothetical protein
MILSGEVLLGKRGLATVSQSYGGGGGGKLSIVP